MEMELLMVDIDPVDPDKWVEFSNALRESNSNSFTPKNGLVLWLDAKNMVLITFQSSWRFKVSKWTDLSGNGKHLTQNDSQLRPILIDLVE